MSIFDRTRIPLLSKALNVYALRNKIIGSNIANISTPGYRSQKVSFEEELARTMGEMRIGAAQTHQDHIPIQPSSASEARHQIMESEATTHPSGGQPVSGINDVDIEKEMVELAKNQIRFKFAARMIADTFKGIQKSIRGQQ